MFATIHFGDDHLEERPLVSATRTFWLTFKAICRILLTHHIIKCTTYTLKHEGGSIMLLDASLCQQQGKKISVDVDEHIFF